MWPMNMAIISIDAARVEDVRDLHLGRAGTPARHDLVEHQPGGDDDHAEHDHAAPEDDLLAGVEAVRRHVLAAEHAAGLG